MTGANTVMERLTKEIEKSRCIINDVYSERNHIALLTALVMNDMTRTKQPQCGWYVDEYGVDGFKRVISIAKGKFTIHVPDEMDLGRLPEITVNWDGHTSDEMYKRIQEYASCQKRHSKD